MGFKRSDRLALELQRVIADIIRSELHDPRISPLCSVLRVELSSDLQYSKVFVSVYGTDEEQEQTFIGLEAAKGFIKRCLSDRLKMRKMPHITFVPDDSIAYSVHISELLNKINAKEGQNESNS